MIIENTATSIFVIDDQPLDTIILKMLIKRVDEDIKVEAIDNGQIAIDKLIKLSETEPMHLPDYIFLDLNMPVMNGWQFLREYKRLNLNFLKKIQIYVLSSSVYREDVVKSESNPLVNDFINKPIDFENLKNILNAA